MKHLSMAGNFVRIITSEHETDEILNELEQVFGKTDNWVEITENSR